MTVGTETIAESLTGFEKQTGIKLRLPEGILQHRVQVKSQVMPFWNYLDLVASSTKTVLEIPESGREWKLAPGRESPPPISIDGAFRVEAREIRSVKQFRDGLHRTDLHLQLAWEPRYVVCRIDSNPRIAKLTDDLGHGYPFNQTSRKSSARGNFASLTIPIADIPRGAKELAIVEGSISATGCPEMRTHRFANLNAKQKVEDKRVDVELLGFKKDGRYWSAEISTKYKSKAFPEFESFERERYAHHSATLISPGGESFRPAGFEEIDDHFFFRFEEGEKAGLKIGKLEGWKLEYRYPSTWIDVTVPFKFKGVALP